MTTSYTSLLGLALPVTGELSGTWGDTVNNAITSLLDTAVAGTTTLSSDADVTLTTTSGSSNQARQAIILWTANGSVTRTITAPAQSKLYTVINASAGTQSIKLVGVGPTTGVTIVKGETALCAWNGSDFVKISNYVSGILGLGTGVATALAVNTGSAGAFVVNGGALGTPSSGTVTNLTGTASININGTVGATTPNTGAFTTLSTTGALTYGGVTLSNSVTGTGSMVLSASPTLTGTLNAAAITASGSLSLTGAADHYMRGGSALFWNSTGASGGTTYTYLQGKTNSALDVSASGGINLLNATSVTGALSATDNISITKSASATTGYSTTNSSGGTLARTGLLATGDAIDGFFGVNGSGYTGVSGWGDAGIININSASNGLIFGLDGSTKAQLTSSGLAVTGAFSSTGKALVQGQMQVSGGFTADVANSITLAMSSSDGRVIVEGPDTSTKGTYSLILANSNGTTLVTPHVADASGYNYFVHPTTGASANAVIDATTGLLQRSTSSLRYKIDVEPIADSAKVLQLDPIWYRSNPETCPNDNPQWSWYSFSAEQAAEIDPRFVHWVKDEDGTLIPDSVQDRPIIAMLLDQVKSLSYRVSQLESK